MRRIKIFKINIALNLMIAISAVKSMLIPYVSWFRESLMLMIAVFMVRAYIGGYVVPKNTALIVNAIQALDTNAFIYGVSVYVVAGLVHIATEFALQKYFVKLADGIIKIKEIIVNNLHKIKTSGEINLEDLVGRISSDVDFVVWNLNTTLTTFIPNVFTSVSAMVTLFFFDRIIGLATLPLLIPYIVIAEYYSRRAENARLKERQAYAISIVHIRDVVYGSKDGNTINNSLSSWKNFICKVMWYDRIYWGASLLTLFSSIAFASYITYLQASINRIDVGMVAGILSAISTAHSTFMNAIWALCIQSQTAAAMKRIIECITLNQKPKIHSYAYMFSN